MIIARGCERLAVLPHGTIQAVLADKPLIQDFPVVGITAIDCLGERVARACSVPHLAGG